MSIGCSLKERYDRVRLVEYKVKNINRAKVFFEFVDSSYREKIPFGEIIEVKGEKLKNIFRSIADYNLKSYLKLLSPSLALVQSHLIDPNVHSEYKYKIKVIKNKKNNNETEAIFYYSASIKNFFNIGKSTTTTFYFSISQVFISKEFLIKLAESSKIFYKNEIDMIEAIDNFILFLEKSHERFFLISFGFFSEHILRLVPDYFDSLSIKFIFELKETDIYALDDSGLETIEAVKKEKYLKLKLEDLMDIVNVGGSNYEKETSVKKLIRGIFINLLFYHFNDEEPPEIKFNLGNLPIEIVVEYGYNPLEKDRMGPLLSSSLNVLEAISNVPSGYESKDVFEGNLAVIRMEVRNSVHLEISIYCSVKPDYSEAGNEKIFLEIKVRPSSFNYRGVKILLVSISVLYRESFKNVYMNERKLDIFISDFGNFLTRLGLFSNFNEFLFWAKAAKVLQIFPS